MTKVVDTPVVVDEVKEHGWSMKVVDESAVVHRESAAAPELSLLTEVLLSFPASKALPRSPGGF